MSNPDKDRHNAQMVRVCRQLAEIRDAPSAKRVADLARAAAVFARRQKLGREAIANARGVEVEALTVMARFYQSGEKNRGGQGRAGGGTCGSKKEPQVSAPPTLPELGIGKKESAEGKALLTLETESPDLYAKVRANEMTTARARQEKARREYEEGPNHTPDLPTTTYRCIVADPPWPMKKSERSARPDQGPRVSYETKPIAWIRSLPVKELVNPRGCHLYLWVTDLNGDWWNDPEEMAAHWAGYWWEMGKD